MSENNFGFYFFLLGDSRKASSRVRGIWVVEELRLLKVKSHFGVHLTVLDLFIQGLWEVRQFKYVVFQKTFSKYHVLLAKLLKYFGKIVILDIDDYPSFNQDSNTLSNFEKMVQTVNCVFVGSENLKLLVEQYKGNPILIPTGIAIEKYNYPKPDVSENDPITIGWIGNAKYYAQDLIEILLPALNELTSKNQTLQGSSYEQRPICLKLIGTNNNEQLKRSFDSLSNVKVEYIDQLDWGNSEEVNESLGDIQIGVYPLLPRNENNFKCGFKALEYLASGIPVVSSDISINRQIVLHGETGYLANNQSEWVQYLRMLIESDELRTQMAKKGREHVENRYSTQKIAQTILREINHVK